MKIDIREVRDAVITEIYFADDEFVSNYNSNYIVLENNCYTFQVNKSDIDNLIKALQKAQELWRE